MTIEEIYNAHKNLVYNLALQYVQNIEDAEEITQDVFVAAYTAMDSFKHEAKISTWLYRITINKSLDYLRARKRKKRFAFLSSIFSADGELQHEGYVFNHPGVQLEQKEVLQFVFRMINDLPDSQKTALILSKIENLSQVQVGEIMELSPKAVESLVQRAKTNLLKKMNSEGK